MSETDSATAVRDSITAAIDIEAPIGVVWKLVSEPGWWINDGPLESHDITTTRRADGGVVAEVVSAKHGLWRVIVVELREPEYAAFRWAVHDEAQKDATTPAGSTLIEFTLRERAGGVVVEVVESGFAALPIAAERASVVYKGNVEGWAMELAELERAARS